METFRNKLKKRIVFGSVYCCLIPLLAIVLHFCVGETLSSGFTLGFATGIAAVALFFVVQSARHFAIVRNSEKCISRKRTNGISIFKVAAQFRVF